MGCNAWNHPPDCNCGWGGDTGGGGYSGIYAKRIADGRLWSNLDLTYDSFTIPNASCPVCGDPVFFYQSPYGGRVFFDELGPPWPKHPCTDTGTSGSARRSGTHFTAGSVLGDVVFKPPQPTRPQVVPQRTPHEWRPLVTAEGKRPERIGTYWRVPVHVHDQVPGQRFYVPTGWVGETPVYWRWKPDDIGWIELSTIRFGQGLEPESVIVQIPGWLRNDREFEAWASGEAPAPDAEQWAALGWTFSFAWQFFGDFPHWYVLFKGIDFKLALQCFEIAAKSGLWNALYNLGVLYRDGLGVDKDPEKAFDYFRRAAESMEPAPIRHLAKCYREGFGCAIDIEMADYLDELASAIEAERQ